MKFTELISLISGFYLIYKCKFKFSVGINFHSPSSSVKNYKLMPSEYFNVYSKQFVHVLTGNNHQLIFYAWNKKGEICIF